MFVTKQAMCKIVDGGEFDVSKRTTAATKLNEGDEVLSVAILSGQKSVILKTHDGYFIRFATEEIPEKKKAAVGVRGMKLQKGDLLSDVFYTYNMPDEVINVDEKEVFVSRIKLSGRDGKGTKLRI